MHCRNVQIGDNNTDTDGIKSAVKFKKVL